MSSLIRPKKIVTAIVTAIAQCFDSADGVPGEMKPNRNHKHVVCRKCSAARRERQLGYRSSWTGCTSCRRVLQWLKSLIKCTKISLARNIDWILLVQAWNSNYPLKYLNILQRMFYLLGSEFRLIWYLLIRVCEIWPIHCYAFFIFLSKAYFSQRRKRMKLR